MGSIICLVFVAFIFLLFVDRKWNSIAQSTHLRPALALGLVPSALTLRDDNERVTTIPRNRLVHVQ